MLATGKRVEDVARDLGVSKFSLYRTIKGQTKGVKPRNLISEIIGKPVSEIWPDVAKKEG